MSSSKSSLSTAHLNNLFAEIESREFSAVGNIASTLKMFITAVSQDARYRELEDRVKLNPSLSEVLVDRVRVLSTRDFDHRFHNPNDVALSVYVCILSSRFSQGARLAAKIAMSARHVWWSIQIGNLVLDSNLNVPSTIYIVEDQLASRYPDNWRAGISAYFMNTEGQYDQLMISPNWSTTRIDFKTLIETTANDKFLIRIQPNYLDAMPALNISAST